MTTLNNGQNQPWAHGQGGQGMYSQQVIQTAPQLVLCQICSCAGNQLTRQVQVVVPARLQDAV